MYIKRIVNSLRELKGSTYFPWISALNVFELGVPTNKAWIAYYIVQNI